jgi:D-alanyl-lipoteichoic acid acyltransferase DltB (MBOAT superfamily)
VRIDRGIARLYGWWDTRFIPLPVGQIGTSWLLARLQQATGRKAFLVIGVIFNLGSLATFKYLDFLVGSAETVIGVTLPRAHLVLPIGISFFSFQLISYLVDRMRNDARSMRSGRSHCSCCCFRTGSPGRLFVITSWCRNSPTIRAARACGHA